MVVTTCEDRPSPRRLRGAADAGAAHHGLPLAADQLGDDIATDVGLAWTRSLPRAGARMLSGEGVTERGTCRSSPADGAPR